jgi:hypothetical protein
MRYSAMLSYGVPPENVSASRLVPQFFHPSVETCSSKIFLWRGKSDSGIKIVDRLAGSKPSLEVPFS